MSSRLETTNERPSMSTTTPETLVTTDSRLERGDAEKGAATHTGKTKKERSPHSFIAQLPSFKEFILNEWKDLGAMALITLITNVIPPAVGERLFPLPINPVNNELDVSALINWGAFPNRLQIIPVWLSALLAILPPFVIFFLFQIKMRSYPDLHASVFGLLTTLVHGTAFQVVLKAFVGGLRPYFYDACKPDMERAREVGGVGLANMMFDYTICTGEWKEIRKALTGWPSGHSNAAMGSAVFLSLYLNAKLKIFADTRGRYWKMFVFFLPIIIGMGLCGLLNMDQSHTWYDILTGGTIGAVCAISSYRLRYAALWDFRFNHIPLPKSSFKLKNDGLHLGDVDESAAETTTPKKKRGLFSRRRGQYTSNGPTASRLFKSSRKSQRFTYDLPTIANNYPILLLDSRTGKLHPNPHVPVMTRHFQGSAVGAPGNASWQGYEGVQGVMGDAHSPEEYGRVPPNRGPNVFREGEGMNEDGVRVEGYHYRDAQLNGHGHGQIGAQRLRGGMGSNESRFTETPATPSTTTQPSGSFVPSTRRTEREDDRDTLSRNADALREVLQNEWEQDRQPGPNVDKTKMRFGRVVADDRRRH